MSKVSRFSLSSNSRAMNSLLTKRNANLQGTKVLVIAQPRIGAGELKIEDSCDIFVSEINKIIEKLNATDVIILGKIISIKQSCEKMGDNLLIFIKSLEKVSAKVHIISSKEERVEIANIKTSEVDIIKEYSTFFTYGTGENTINFFFCDDAGNNFTVDPDAGCRFVMFLKNIFSNQIAFKDYLCSGHISPAFIDTQAKVASPGVFNHEKGKLEYLSIDFTEEIEIQIYTDIDTEDYRTRQPVKQDGNCLI